MLTEHEDDSGSTICENYTSSQDVVDVVAAAKGVDPMELNPLYDVMDPDALDAVLARDTHVEVTFEYADCLVVVRPDSITVDAREQ